MAAPVQVKVPDIGDFRDVQVIEILVKAGQSIKAEQSLITLESDKASMEIPSPMAGIVRELKLKLGDKVSEGSPILELEPAFAPGGATAGKPAEGDAAAPPAASPAPAAAAPVAAPPPPTAQAPSPAPAGGEAEFECEVVVLGSGPGGYSAAFRAADLGRRVLLVERYPTLGGV
ncbi:MAG TPA: biotin/lipoyl-containing protein, partial [Burkholderiaceae bacterium]|nr:biotin/lipoyl-containing protein [Burkholderiaceae bacterium]